MRLGLIVEQLLATVPGGAGRYASELARAVAASAAAGDEVRSFSAWHSDVAAARVPGVSGPHRFSVPPPVLARLWQHGLPPAPHNVDVVHAPTPLMPTTSIPTVVTIFDAVPWTHPETLTDHGAAWHRAMAERAVRQGAAVTTAAQVVADELAEVLPGLDRSRIHVLGAGVSDRLTAEPSADVTAEVRRRLGLPDWYLMSLATVEPRKGLDVLIRALAALGESAPPLVVAGQAGWGGVEPEKLAADAGLDPSRVLVTGRLSDADLSVVLRHAAALVMPSRAEGFGLPAVEAMAVGTPVICTDVPALVEVTDGHAVVVPVGAVQPLAGAIEALLGDWSQRARLSAAGRLHAAHHSWSAVAERAWSLYRSLL